MIASMINDRQSMINDRQISPIFFQYSDFVLFTDYNHFMHKKIKKLARIPTPTAPILSFYIYYKHINFTFKQNTKK